MRFLTSIGRFGYALLVGEDWKVAAGAVAAIVAGAVCLVAGVSDRAVLLVTFAAVLTGFVLALAVEARRTPPAENGADDRGPVAADADAD